jgi:hypothetical protein
LHCFNHRNVPSVPDGSVLRVACAARTCCAKKRVRIQAAKLEKLVGEGCGRLNTTATAQVVWRRERKTLPEPDGRLHPTPGNTKPRSWAGLLTRRHPFPAPSRANYIAQWHITGIVRLTAAGGCAGMSVDTDRLGVTDFPFHLAPRLRDKTPKTGEIVVLR